MFKDFAVSFERGDALDRLRFHDFKNGTWKEIAYPEPVYAVVPGSTPDYESHTYRYNYQSLVTPSSVFDYEVATGKSTLRKQQEVLGGYDPTEYTSERLWATARDGVKVPISIVYKKGFVRDGKAPLFQYGYGSYGYGLSAAFSSSRVSLSTVVWPMRSRTFAVATKWAKSGAKTACS